MEEAGMVFGIHTTSPTAGLLVRKVELPGDTDLDWLRQLSEEVALPGAGAMPILADGAVGVDKGRRGTTEGREVVPGTAEDAIARNDGSVCGWYEQRAVCREGGKCLFSAVQSEMRWEKTVYRPGQAFFLWDSFSASDSTEQSHTW